MRNPALSGFITILARLAVVLPLAGVAPLAIPAALAQGHGHGGWHGGWRGGWHGGWYGGIGIGLWGWPYYWDWPYYGYGYYYPPAYPAPYPAPAPVAQQAPAAPPSWYYCSDPKGYYPYVQSCKVQWQQVPAVPPATPPGAPR